MDALSEVVTPLALLFQMMVFVNVGDELELDTAPPSFARFPWKVQLMRAGEELLKLSIAPPFFARFPWNVQFVIVGEELKMAIAPPLKSALFPMNRQLVILGDDPPLFKIAPPLAFALLSLKIQFASVGEDVPMNIPPPLALLFAPLPSAFPAWMVNPCRMVVASRLLALRTWWLLLSEVPSWSMSPERMVRLARGSASARSVALLLKPP